MSGICQEYLYVFVYKLPHAGENRRFGWIFANRELLLPITFLKCKCSMQLNALTLLCTQPDHLQGARTPSRTRHPLTTSGKFSSDKPNQAKPSLDSRSLTPSPLQPTKCVAFKRETLRPGEGNGSS